MLYNNSNSAPEYATDKIQKPADRAKKSSSFFNFTFIIELWPNMFLSKQKMPYYTTIQMARWLSSSSVSQAVPKSTHRFKSCLGQFEHLFVFYFVNATHANVFSNFRTIFSYREIVNRLCESDNAKSLTINQGRH